MWWWWIGGCGAEAPWERVWALSLHGRPVGVVRARGGDAPEWRRELTVSADGEAVVHTSSLSARRAPDGSLRDWVLTTDGERRGAGPVYEPWLALPPSSGAWPTLSGSGDVAPRAVVRDGDAVTWDLAGGPARLVLVDGEPHHGSWAGTTFTAAPLDAPLPPPLDVAAVLSRPAPPLARPRKALRSRWQVDGAEVVVDAPMAEELPPNVLAEVRALARRVADDIPDVAAPFGAPTGGDCTEHVARFLPVAAAAGYAVRPAAGFVYLDAPEPRLWLHAWAEVDVGGRWVAVDPTFGTFPADAARLRTGSDAADLAAADRVDVTIVDLR